MKTMSELVRQRGKRRMVELQAFRADRVQARVVVVETARHGFAIGMLGPCPPMRRVPPLGSLLEAIQVAAVCLRDRWTIVADGGPEPEIQIFDVNELGFRDLIGRDRSGLAFSSDDAARAAARSAVGYLFGDKISLDGGAA